MKRKYLILSIMAGLLLTVTAVLVIADATLQRSTTLNAPSVGAFPIVGSETLCELSPGLTFRLSSAASISQVTPATLRWLKAQGCVTDSTIHPVIYRDNSDELCTASRFYKVDLPLARYSPVYDSVAGRNYLHCDPSAAGSGRISNVEVIVADSADCVNTLGSDFLRRFILEYNQSEESVVFHDHLPEGYQMLGDIRIGHSLADIIGTGVRYYADMKVDHETYTMMLNTALADMALKMPSDRMAPADNDHQPNIMWEVNPSGEQSRTIDISAWIEYGNRAGSRQVCYRTDGGSKYEFNPFELFEQDVVIDFVGHSIYLRPYYDISSLTE